MSYYQISSGSGPVECELAVAMFLRYLLDNYPGVEVIETAAGYERGTLKSACIKSEADLGSFIGTIRWTCKSPFRPGHRHKNWFISFDAFAENAIASFDESRVVSQTIRSGGAWRPECQQGGNSGARNLYSDRLFDRMPG